MPRLVVESFEEGVRDPVVVHVFEGATRADVEAFVEAHRGSDKFFAAGEENGEYQGIKVSNKRKWEEAKSSLRKIRK